MIEKSIASPGKFQLKEYWLPVTPLSMHRATLIPTDSGGVQEEAPSLGKPVLVMRNTTERPEAVEAEPVKLVGTNIDSIFNWVDKLCTDEKSHQMMSKAHNPYGDGQAANRIVEYLESVLRNPQSSVMDRLY